LRPSVAAHARLRAAGKRTGVNVRPHRLRHSFATQLLNAGCKVTSIQHILGHKRLNTTMLYARAHDAAVAKDYFAAMEVVEEQLELTNSAESSSQEQVDAMVQVRTKKLFQLLDSLPLDHATRAMIGDELRGLINALDGID
jgi:hypothetical protein